jgi:acetyl-CoA C-acetyltransferase
MREVAIVAAVRLPVGRVNGSLAKFRAEKLGAMVVNEAVRRAGIATENIDEIIFCSDTNEDLKIAAGAVAREAGLPSTIPAYQIRRGCASSLTALWDGAMMIRTGFADTVLCGGCESFTMAPFCIDCNPAGSYYSAAYAWCAPIFSPTPYDRLPNGGTVDEIAGRYGISRGECDEFSANSHRKGAAAYKNGYFDSQLLSVEIRLKGGKTALFNRDEPLQGDCSAASLAKLKPFFTKGGVSTVGNSSPLSDGASCVILMERGRAETLGLDIMALMTDFADAGCEPGAMGEGSVCATRKLLAKTGLTLSDFDLIEMNEAFAAQSIRCARELDMDPDRLNVNGGAIALGHPLSAAGAILATKLVYEMRRRDVKRGLVTFCVDGSLGVSAMFERP